MRKRKIIMFLLIGWMIPFLAFAQADSKRVTLRLRTGASAYQYYVNAGNNIYYCATGGVPEAPVLVCSIPAEYGEVEYLGLSALGNRLVVVAYDESSSEERKGTVLFVDLSTRQITHTFPHILHHCSGFWGANDANSTFLAGYGDNM